MGWSVPPGPAVRSVDGIPNAGYAGVVHWSADNEALLYVQTVGGVSNIWRRPLDRSAAEPVTAFTCERITSFAVCRDGKKLTPAAHPEATRRRSEISSRRNFPLPVAA